MTPTIEEIHEEARQALTSIQNLESLESFRIAFLGKKGKITALFDHIKELPNEEKRSFGAKVNQLRDFAEKELASLKEKFASTSTSSSVFFDETLPAISPTTGRIHPLTKTFRDICKIFHRMGFEIVDGPEVETEFHNFTALNIPLDHPAREGFDTFYTESRHLLRSQTSTVQIRVMQNHKPPLRVIAPGRVYRPDTVDASHSFMFHQIEGLFVDEHVTFAELKGILHHFIREFFGSSTRIRFRPHFFPFTEPSVEVDIEWGKKGWLEILGAGTVDPNVFKAVGYNPKKVRGWAFGMGVERMTMLRHGITDIRHFYDNDLRFLRQFS